MAQEYTISNVYPVMKADKVTQSSFEAHGNKLLKWRLFFEGIDGHYVTNRKEDNAPQKGDVVYGELGQDQFGNATFKSESRPLGELPSQPAKSQSQPAASGGDIEAKLDYLITLVEQLADHEKDVVLEDIDDKPIDLSEIPF